MKSKNISNIKTFVSIYFCKIFKSFNEPEFIKILKAQHKMTQRSTQNSFYCGEASKDTHFF